MKKLNFGCGHDIRDDMDNIDIEKRNEEKIIKTFDFNLLPYPIKDNTYDYIMANQVIEHLYEPKKVIMELWRITKPNGIIHIEVPHYSNKSSYTDFEHKTHFSDTTFLKLGKKFWEENNFKGWENDNYYFEVISIELNPTKIGKFIPKKIREKLSLFIFGLINGIIVDLKVLK